MHKILVSGNEDVLKLLKQVAGTAMLPEAEVCGVKDKGSEYSSIIIIDLDMIPDIIPDSENAIYLSRNSLEPAKGLALQKPYHIKELVGLIQNIIQRQFAKGQDMEIGQFIFSPTAKILSNGSEIINLTEKEAALIKMLYQEKPNPVSSERILKEVWGYEAGVDTHTIETHIYRIRQKIGKEADFIVNTGGGYSIT